MPLYFILLFLPLRDPMLVLSCFAVITNVHLFIFTILQSQTLILKVFSLTHLCCFSLLLFIICINIVPGNRLRQVEDFIAQTLTKLQAATELWGEKENLVFWKQKWWMSHKNVVMQKCINNTECHLIFLNLLRCANLILDSEIGSSEANSTYRPFWSFH